jgi:nucleoside 2-deoxyribosyltransferase
MVKGYLANGLFSLADRMFNECLAEELRETIPELKLFVPQEQDFNDKSTYANSITIAQGDTEAISESDFIVAVIDGVEVDSGVAAEIGYATAIGIPVYALYSDVRQQGRDNAQKIAALMIDGTENQFMYRNLFVLGLIKGQSVGGVFADVDSLINKLVEDFAI